MPVMRAVFLSIYCYDLMIFLSLNSGELCYALFLGELTDEESVILFRHYVSVEPLHHHLLLFRGVYDAVMRVEERDVLSYDSISIKVLFRLCEQ